MSVQKKNVQVVASNRKARHDFAVEDTFEAGMVLQGTEVKSLRLGNCSLNESFARPLGGEIFLLDAYIAPYEQGNIRNHEPTRPRKLLLHKREIARIVAQCSQRGFTLVPLAVYFREGYAKVEIGLAHRRRTWDKREKKASEQRRKDATDELNRRRRP